METFTPISQKTQSFFIELGNSGQRAERTTGRATIEALGMNRTAIVLIRRELILLNRFPQ